MSEEERQAIIHLLDKQARYEYCIKNNISFSDEDYEAYIIRQSMINKDKEIERLNNIIKRLEEFIEKEIELYTVELTEENKNKLSIVAPIKGVYKEIYNVLKELKGSDSNE